MTHSRYEFIRDRLERTIIDCDLDKLHAEGSGLRLSWPYVSDSRRAVVGKSPPLALSRQNKTRHESDARIVHVSYGDVEMHYHFGSSLPPRYTKPVLNISIIWNPLELEVEAQDVLQYFQRNASRSLAIFGHDPATLGHVLIRIALSSSKPSARAVLQALLALSMLHRHGIYTQSIELKIAALNSLAAAAGSYLDTTEAIRHVAAGMLLCSFETHQSSCLSGQWIFYLAGVKNIIKEANLDLYRQDSDLAMLLDWVNYYDVLARFTQRHWHRDREMAELLATPSRVHTDISYPGGPPALATIELLADVCDALPSSPLTMPPSEIDPEYKRFLKILDWRITGIVTTTKIDSSVDRNPLLMELYHLAMLVYLNRTTGKLLKHSARTQEQIEKAFTLIPRLDTCDRQFPVFILGCEARTDEQRAVVLDLISRTERGISSRSFNHVKLLLEAVWAQGDLADRDVSYWDQLDGAISRCSIMPIFV